MTSQQKWIYGGLVALLLVGGAFVWANWGPDESNGAAPVAGAAGNLLAEDYVPYVQYNDGYTSQNGITLVGADGDIVSGDDITAGDDLIVTDDATISGGTFTVTTSNTATSTLIVGCVQTTATSTATPIKQMFVTTGATSTFAGTVYWNYGTCP